MTYTTVRKGLKLPAGKGFVVRDTHVLIAGQVGVIGSMQAGYVDDSLEEDCLFSGDPDERATPENALKQKGQKWPSRTFNRRRRRVVRVKFRNGRQEHGDYCGWAGDMLFLDCIFEGNGSSGNQGAQREMDSIGGRADNVACLVSFQNCKWLDNALPTGTRQTWSSSMFAWDENIREYYPDGPLILTPQGNPQKGHLVRSKTDLEYINGEFVGGYYPHDASGGRHCLSTGGILIQDRERAHIKRCSFDYPAPDREIVQFRNVADAFMEPCLFKQPGGTVVLHDMDNCHVKIMPCTGIDGEIRRRVLGSHTTTLITKLSKGYSH
jgi:hypothetical protein